MRQQQQAGFTQPCAWGLMGERQELCLTLCKGRNQRICTNGDGKQAAVQHCLKSRCCPVEHGCSRQGDAWKDCQEGLVLITPVNNALW